MHLVEKLEDPLPLKDSHAEALAGDAASKPEALAPSASSAGAAALPLGGLTKRRGVSVAVISPML